MFVKKEIKVSGKVNGFSAKIALWVAGEVVEDTLSDSLTIKNMQILTVEDDAEGQIYSTYPEDSCNKIEDFRKAFGVTNLFLDCFEKSLYEQYRASK